MLTAARPLACGVIVGGPAFGQNRRRTPPSRWQPMKKLILSLAAALGISPAAQPTPSPAEQAVIVQFRYGSTNLDALFSAEDRLEAAIAAAKAGEFDGHEIAMDGSDGTFYMYGPDADQLYRAVEPVLKAIPFMTGAVVTRRYGPPQDGVKTVVTTIDR